MSKKEKNYITAKQLKELEMGFYLSKSYKNDEDILVTMPQMEYLFKQMRDVKLPMLPTYNITFTAANGLEYEMCIIIALIEKKDREFSDN